MSGEAFSDEVFNYWIPRLVADGVDANDAQIVRGRVTGWEDWPKAWAERAESYLALADARRSNGATVSAGEALVRASLCFHVGQVVAFHAPELKRALQARKVAAFRDAAPLLLPPAERVEITHDGITLPGYLRLPVDTSGPVPCAILVPGLDSTKEDFITVSEMCVRRGLASFVFDGPGQGEVRPHATLAEGYETAILSVVEAVSGMTGVDSGRIGVLGRSLGGFYILRAAARDRRIKACAVFGGTYDLSDRNDMPDTILDGFRYATDSETREQARAKMGPASLDDCIGDVTCPTLVVHGKRDAIFDYRQAERIADALGDRAQLLMEEDGVHCCHNYAFKYRSAMADWLAATL